jgi:hypothetical protein
MATPVAPREDPAQVLAAISGLLLALTEGECVLISSDSLELMIRQLTPRLVVAARHGDCVAMAQSFERRLREGRPVLLDLARTQAARFGQPSAVFNEEVGRRALTLCPPPPDFPG